MIIRRLFRSPRARRGLAAGAIVLSMGGLVLARTPAAGHGPSALLSGDYRHMTRFSGPGASGTLALSHGKVLAEGRTRMFAELRIRADETEAPAARAPLALVIVLDTSGSMSGAKIEEAKRSVIAMLRQMDPNDQVAFVRYDTDAELVQPMATVSEVRASLIDRVSEMEAGGGTNIPAALSAALRAGAAGADGRIERIVLVSDGLDSGRPEAERLALQAGQRDTTVSALGVGLDFDESYMAAVARAGRGNFAFVESPAALARFLERELHETASTVVQGVAARLRLPASLRFVRAVGAQATGAHGFIDLHLGSLYAGDERRVIVELEATAPWGAELSIATELSWDAIGGAHAELRTEPLMVAATGDPAEVAAQRDPRVMSSAMSALASLQQLEAAEAFARGDTARAQQLIEQNVASLNDAAAAAPPEMADALREQAHSYQADKGRFASAPGSAEGRAAAKSVTAKEAANLGRATY